MMNLEVVKYNNYVRENPVELLQQTKQQITYGPDNSYLYFLQNVIVGSPTLSAVIDSYVGYIVADGLVDTSGGTTEDILSRHDLNLIVHDFKSTGNATIQVVYELGNPGVVAKLYHIPVSSVAIKKQNDLSLDPVAYWYCADWRLKTKFKPIEVPAFGTDVNNKSEILYIRRPSPQPLFSLPDWQPSIQFAIVEEELSNYYSSHIKNGFSGGTIVNINQGASAESQDAQEEARRKIINKLTGSSNAGRVIVSFNDNVENKTTVDSIVISDAYQQFEFLTRECREKIFLANGVVDPALFGFANASGFSSQAEQMVTSLKLLYRNKINPIREMLLKGLTPAFRTINPNIRLDFKDFEELQVTTPAQA